MGASHSKAYYTDPAQFATLVDAEAPLSSEPLRDYITFDYIIVGAGAAGAVLASRLSEDPSVTVLLVEAGEDNQDSPFSKIPIAFGKHFRTKFDWEYYTTPQSNLKDRKMYWPQGKMLGGSTSINAMMYHRCSPSDFNEWEAIGATGWSYKDLAPYFHKAEKYTANILYPDVDVAERGDSGLWQTGYHYKTEICSKPFLDACSEVGIPSNPDINTPRGTLGATVCPTFIDPSGKRSSAATAYLTKDVVARNNLKIAIRTQATRIFFDNSPPPTAVGIEVATDENSPRYRIAARKEVIISAGALSTPKILNLSGIGAKSELQKFGIQIIKELPAVGKNLADHLAAGPIIYRARPGYTLDYMASDIKSLPAVIYWMFTGKGPATSNVAESAVFVRSTDDKLRYASEAVTESPKITDVTSGSDGPDIEIIAAPVPFLDHGFGIAPPGSLCYTLYPILLRPLSLGSVSLKSVNPFEKAIVDANYLADPNDMKILNRAVRLGFRIARAKALEPYLDIPSHSEDKSAVNIFWPGDADPDHVSDDDLEDWIRGHAETLYHPVGTARMGLSEKDSVVGPDLKVHGVNGLRVIDASIFPKQISGHTSAPVIAIAEKAAEMINNGAGT